MANNGTLFTLTPQGYGVLRDALRCFDASALNASQKQEAPTANKRSFVFDRMARRRPTLR